MTAAGRDEVTRRPRLQLPRVRAAPGPTAATASHWRVCRQKWHDGCLSESQKVCSGCPAAWRPMRRPMILIRRASGRIARSDAPCAPVPRCCHCRAPSQGLGLASRGGCVEATREGEPASQPRAAEDGDMALHTRRVPAVARRILQSIVTCRSWTKVAARRLRPQRRGMTSCAPDGRAMRVPCRASCQ